MTPNPPLFRIGRSVINPSAVGQQPGVGQTDEPARPVNLVHDSPTLSEYSPESLDARAN